MKRVFLFAFMLHCGFAQWANAQNVGIGTNTPASSAMLDVSSSTRGLLAPRMTTAQRTAVVSPAKGLLVYDTDLNALYHYNGSAWAAVGGGGGGFSLPYEATVNLNTAALKITNAGAGAAIQAITTNEFGFALQANNTTSYGYSVYAYSRSPNAVSVYGIGDSSTAVKAESGKGIALDARSNDSIAVRARIQLGTNADPVILATHSGLGIAVDASSVSGAAVRGTSANASGAIIGTNTNAGSGVGVYGGASGSGGQGVRGESQSGTGVLGYSNNGTGVSGGSLGGTALYGNSISGYSLDISGKVKIAGGNTSPGAGKVLTSVDASGNAVWQQPAVNPKIAFKATGVGGAHDLNLIPGGPLGSPIKLEFKNEQYDFGSNYALYAGTVNAASSNFTAPVNGVYHFDAAITFIEALLIPYTSVTVYIKLSRNGTVSTISKGTNEISDTENIFAQTSTDVFLFAGDRIWVEVEQWNATTVASPLEDKAETVFFNGHLVFAQ